MGKRKGRKEGEGRIQRFSNSLVSGVLGASTGFGWDPTTQDPIYTRSSPHLEEGFQPFKQHQVCGQVDKGYIMHLSP